MREIISNIRMNEIMLAVINDDKESLGAMTAKEEEAYESIKEQYERDKDKGLIWDVTYDC